jgi:hypothetical protein
MLKLLAAELGYSPTTITADTDPSAANRPSHD